MLDGGVSYESTGESSIYLPLSGMVDYVSAAGLRATFTTCTAGAGWLGTGENTTTSFDVYVENVTHLDISDD